MKKKIIIGWLLIILAVSIAGCGKGDAEQQQEIVQEDVPIEKVEEELVSEERNSQAESISDDGEEVTLSEKEQKGIETLISMLSLNSYFYGGDMYGGHYPADDVSVNMKLIDMLGNMGLADSSYMEYLPPTETDDATLIRYCKPDDVQEYLRNVFGIENADLSTYCEGDRVVFDMVGDYIWTEISVDNSVMTAEGMYKIGGEFILWNIEETPEAVYPYELTVIKNDASPFGFQLISMEYQEEVTEDYESAEQTVTGNGSLSDILLNPDGNKMFYPQEVEYKHMLFALLDIDQDGEDEILLGSASDISPYWGASWVTIFNILKYDRATGEVSDFDGEMVYKPLDANSWHYYDTGNLLTMAEIGNGHTNCWNLLTGEFTDTEAVNPDYTSLTSGNEIRIIWCEVNQGNVEALLTNGNIAPVYIPMPHGSYKANGGAELEFYNDNTVLVSEGNSHTKCVFTIDGMGNLVIDPDGEAIEGIYDALVDEIRIDVLKFRK